jgi:heme a synthase
MKVEGDVNSSDTDLHISTSAAIAIRFEAANASAPLSSATSPISETCEIRNHRWLHRFALLTAAATLGLIGAGGLVTSHEAGMAVPDWPNTYGYNMFLFPVSQWLGGIFYEHTHRLVAALVGLLTTILAAWLWTRETRGVNRWAGLGGIVLVLGLMGVRALPIYLALALLAPLVAGLSLWQLRRYPNQLRWWGAIALAAVILQGVLGGLRVVWLKDQIGILHAALAQVFFVVTCLIALRTSGWGSPESKVQSPRSKVQTPKSEVLSPKSEFQGSRFKVQGSKFAPALSLGRRSHLSLLLRAATLLIFCQLILGAAMRHQHAGLAIPDFPMAYGHLWPATDADSVARYNQQRLEITAVNPITRVQILLQMTHRLMAIVILGVVAASAWLARRRLGPGHYISRLAPVWLGMIVMQALLGAATIWSDKAADVATAHVLIGALSLALGAILSVALGGARVPGMVPIEKQAPEAQATAGAAHSAMAVMTPRHR